MLLPHLKRFCALAVAVLALTTVASLAPASAQESEGGGEGSAAVVDSEVGTQALAPPCVRVGTRSDFWSYYVDVTNLCGYTLRAKVIIAWGYDSPCHELDSGEGFTHAHSSGHFDRLELC